MDRQAASTLAAHKQELRDELPEDGPRLLDVLQRAQFDISSVKRASGPAHRAPYLIYTKPVEHLRQAFGLAPEVLVVVLPGGEAQARDLERAEHALSRELRLDRSIVLAFARDPDAGVRLAPVARGSGRHYLFFTFEELCGVGDPQRWLRTTMRERLGAADLFAPSRPVFGWDFFGRDKELDGLRRHLDAGRPVGLYGLRKVGKTSLVLHEFRRCARETRETRQAGRIGLETLALHIDMQALGPRECNTAGFMRRLVKSTHEALEPIGIKPQKLGLDPALGRAKALRALSDRKAERLGPEVLETCIDWASDGEGRRVLVFIDEYERLYDDELFPTKQALIILDYLRGLVQTYPIRFNFIIAGLTGRHAQQSMIGRRQNPLFKLVVDFPLAGLTRDELGHLLRRIGTRLGLRFDHEAVTMIWEQTGGHPALAREYGRIIDRDVSPSERLDGAKVGRVRASSLYPAYARQVQSTMVGISHAASEVDEQCPYVLSEFARGHSSAPASLAPLAEDVVEHLRRLGILTRSEQGWHIGIQSFAAWLVDNFPGLQEAALGG